MKTLKFSNHLVPLILSGEKDCTWRMFDDKDLKQGDELTFLNRDTGKTFGTGAIISMREKRFGDIEESDFEGHETFENKEKMFETYTGYYGDRVTPESVVKIIKFQFKKT